MEDKKLHKLAVAARMFEQNQEKTEKYLLRRAIAPLPNKELKAHLPDIDLASVERIGSDLMRIDLKRGRTFFGHRSEQKEYLWHHLLKRIIPNEIDGDAYKLALDIQRRYFDIALPKCMSKGGIFIEGGCFTGLKAMRWHDALGGDCRILAVEIGRPNYEIMRLNFDANDMAAITPIHAGLWREDGTMEQRFAHSTRRFLEETERWKGHMKYSETVETLSIDTLLDRHEIETADYMNIQVNGAEIEVLKGFKNLSRIRVLGVAAYYTKDKGVTPQSKLVRDMMVSRGCKVLHDNKLGRLELATPGNY